MQKKKDLVNVIASRAAAYDFFSFFNYLPNPDPVLKRMGKDISVYREMLSDAHVGGCVRRRKAAVKRLEWRITPTNNEKVDDRLNTIFDDLPVSQIILQILDACLFGYQALEVVWEQKDGIWLPKKIEGKPQEWFVFDEDNNLRLRTKEHSIDGIALPDYKFLLATQEATYTNPYGKADLSLCFWAATFKKGGFKFWLEFTEKYGAPWLVGKHPRRAKHNEIDELLDSMEQMIGTAVAAIPDDSSIEFKESSSKGESSQVFDEFLKYCKSEISIALLGQNQTTEQESNRASATAGLEVLEDIRDDDATIVQTVFNTLLKWICDLNFTVEQLPQFELFDQEQVNKKQIERDEKLNKLGVKFTHKYIMRTYDFEEGDIVVEADNTLSDSKKAEFAETDPNHTANPIANGIVEQLEIETEPVIENWLQQIKDELQTAESLEDFRNKLDSLIPELSFSEYGELLAWGETTAQLAGRYSVVTENE
ncbi:DUF935 family protein [Pasteurella skyensis]|uniref:DUF935 family protein n=1 Tax=Phocoenobacter skyensis TaxID=97481 RepID=A0AAJ6N9A8_9PAST|nr:DUF935 family protein [Pasteurella skyensis]MDP8162815.1 DUF935 family protein [Pasteurella skyensis]MDP8172598.1 DUF935 family protein [Pasteurella skyensis]MDP8179098.1 DUF935 family protein [Pasteurella skyensis]MDP8183217.1 DUF935 family protein [Pasteurella skyensis]MDP8189268.1 DUF935 family protein [Pasteurella skyensis]